MSYNIVIHRLTGDGSRENLIGPLWSLNKRDVLNNINKYMKENDFIQGDEFLESGGILDGSNY